MKKYFVIIAIALMSFLNTTLIAKTAIQTDWLGGEGIPGPVINWGNTFDSENNINWYSNTGKLNLDYSAPMEHPVWSTYTNVINTWPVDMDGDGDTDVLGSAGRYSPPYFFSDRIDWWENTNGSGLSWYEHTINGNFDGARDVATADLDGDDDPDILGVAAEDGDISWWDVTCCVTAGELISSILDIEMSADWDSIIWTYDEPSGTSIHFQVRSSMDPLYTGNWSSNITTPGSLEGVLTDGDQYVQYKVFLETTDPGLSPILWDVTISWTELSGIDDEYNFDTTSAIQLLPNYPNPYNLTITIEFNLHEASEVTLNIFNILGEEVSILHTGQLLPGHHSFKWDAFHLVNGLKLYSYKSNNRLNGNEKY